MNAFAFPVEAGTHLPTPEGWKAEMAYCNNYTNWLEWHYRRNCCRETVPKAMSHVYIRLRLALSYIRSSWKDALKCRVFLWSPEYSIRRSCSGGCRQSIPAGSPSRPVHAAAILNLGRCVDVTSSVNVDVVHGGVFGRGRTGTHPLNSANLDLHTRSPMFETFQRDAFCDAWKELKSVTFRPWLCPGSRWGAHRPQAP